jgi:hypothetical protein
MTIDELLEKLVKDNTELKTKVLEQEQDIANTLLLMQQMLSITNTLANRVKALENFSLEINMLMGLMPGNDALTH